MIPAQISADLATLQASVAASSPIAGATPLVKAALVLAAANLTANVQGALLASAGALDGPDPVVAPVDLVTALMSLTDSANDQASLADMRGTTGRAAFNLGSSDMAAPYIGSALPQLVITTDGFTSLFRYAAQYMGNALGAWRIAELNGTTDFWPGPGISLKIPFAADSNDGIPPHA